MNDTIELQPAVVIPCDDRCMYAKHEDCDCTCQGVNHQRGALLTSTQRAITRTDAGRRIRLIAPGTPEWDLAWAVYERREDGETQRDIAADMGLSAPCVRRMIRSLLFTLAAAEAQQEVAA